MASLAQTPYLGEGFYDPCVSTAVLATKLFAPPRRPHLVLRRRLTDQLGEALLAGVRLTLVSAPAGFGKTTVLSDWLAHLHESDVTVDVAWFSLDDADNDLSRFLSHLVAALRGVGLDVGGAVLESLPASSAALTELVNDVARAGEQTTDHRWLVVLDDYHVIESAEVHDAMGFLLEHLPDQVHLVLATRSDPPLPLARLRSRGQLSELRAADLRFTVEEARGFFTGMMGLELTTDDVQALEARTEGWVAGLQLAALSLRGVTERDEIAAFVNSFAGSNRFVIDYLADEVLARQPAPVREFLLRTAVLDRLTGSLCDAVTGGTDGARVLEDLERSNVFLVPLDAQRSWYRYHHLFADVLRARLLSQRVEDVTALHRRASAWFAAHDLAEDAVRHALAGEDFDRAAYLVEEALPDMRRARRDSLLLSWIGSLPDSVVRRSPVLSVVAAWSRLMAGELEAMEVRLDDAERALAAGAADKAIAATWADTEDLRVVPATMAVYRASLAQARGDVGGTVRHAREALDLAGPDDHLVRGSASGFLGLAAWASGDVQEALDTFGDAVRSLHAAGNLVDELDSTIVLADMWLAAGRPRRARSLFEQGLQRATQGGGPVPRATADLHVGLAELDLELDDLSSAQAHLETARVLAERGSITENQHRWYVAMARLRAARGEHDEALDLLDEAAARYRRGFYPDLRPIAATRARLEVARGDLVSAADWARDHDVTVDDPPDYLHEYEHLTLARLLLAQHRAAGPEHESAPAAAALGLLDRLHAAATDAGRDGSTLEIGILRSLAHQALGDRSRAIDVLRQALVDTPEPDGYARLLLDEGDPMLAVLGHLVREPPAAWGPAGATLDHVRHLLAAVAPRATATGQQPLVDPLSERELDVLRLLDSELTGPEIARELYVSLNTLRTHTKRIFTKLDVNTRAAAVRRGRETGLL
jgi:LuxR family maltose regulon positive regulatory protein